MKMVCTKIPDELPWIGEVFARSRLVKVEQLNEGNMTDPPYEATTPLYHAIMRARVGVNRHED